MSASHTIFDCLPSLCQKLSDLVEVWSSYNKNNFACFLRHDNDSLATLTECFKALHYWSLTSTDCAWIMTRLRQLWLGQVIDNVNQIFTIDIWQCEESVSSLTIRCGSISMSGTLPSTVKLNVICHTETVSRWWYKGHAPWFLNFWTGSTTVMQSCTVLHLRSYSVCRIRWPDLSPSRVNVIIRWYALAAGSQQCTDHMQVTDDTTAVLVRTYPPL